MSSEFYGLIPAYVFATLLVSVSNNLGILWIAVELTTLASVFLITFHDRDTSLEAAWKFLVLGSLGLAFAPAGYHGFRTAGGVVPERAPSPGENNGQSDQDQRPAAPGRFFVHGTCEAAECGVSKMTLSGLCAAMSSPVAAAAAD